MFVWKEAGNRKQETFPGRYRNFLLKQGVYKKLEINNKINYDNYDARLWTWHGHWNGMGLDNRSPRFGAHHMARSAVNRSQHK
jgi:hypothetical protein